MAIPLAKLHKATGQAYVYHKGKMYYFGKFGTQAADEKYWAWRASLGKRVAEGHTVRELLAEYQKQKLSKKDKWFLPSLEKEMERFATMTCDDFGPLAYREVRKMLAGKGTRTANTVNEMANVIRKAFKHGVTLQMVTLAAYQALMLVPPLKPDEIERCGRGRRLVPQADVDATLPHCDEHVRNAIIIQLATGARPSEVLGILKSKIERTGAHGTWVYRLEKHKTANKGKGRFLVFGPKSQEAIEAQMRAYPESDWLFPSQRGNWHYKPEGYCNAVTVAAKLAGVPRWTPYQLRHLRLTQITTDHGLETASIVAGHAGKQMTQGYSHEPDAEQIRHAG